MKLTTLSGGFMAAIILSLTSNARCATAHDQSNHAHHDHTLAQALGSPMSIMGDHVHEAGEWMLSYRYMFMDMDGMRQGNDRVSSAQVFAAGPFAVTPEWMTMDMSMVGVMRSVTDRLTFMAMFHYISMEMQHLINPAIPLLGGTNFTTRTEGFGDITLSGLYLLHGDDCFQVIAGLGVSLPTGSIAERDGALRPPPPPPPVIVDQQLPAAMQLGSGTVDILPSLTVTQHLNDFMLGAQVRGRIRTHNNHHGYRFGNQFGVDLWGAWSPIQWCSFVGGVGYQYEGELRGRQSGIGQVSPVGLTVPTAYGSNYGGQRIEATLGMNFVIPRGMLKGNRVGIDVRLPIYQNVNGLQLERDFTLTAGWSWAF